jgi:hypothetical protein
MVARGPASVHSEGLLAFWADIDQDYVLGFQQWHNCEHMRERLAIPGFLAGRRYRGLGDARMFFMFYETQGPEVLGSEAYLAALNRPTPWTQESLQHFRRPLRSAYRKLAEHGPAPRFEVPYIALYRFSLHDESPASLAEMHVATWVAAVSQAAGVYRARLYALDAHVSSIATEERKIYRSAAGEQTYLALYECACPAPWEMDDWRAIEQGLPPEAHPDTSFLSIERETYWLEVALYPAAPGA